MQEIFRFVEGNTPLLISVPHAGSYIPDSIATRMTETGQQSIDTDWHVEKLYDFAVKMGASLIWATHSRYVIDLNRPEDDKNLYPGQDTTGLIPLNSFDKKELYRTKEDYPDQKEQQERVIKYWRPYHDKLKTTLQNLKAQHGHALLWEAHSIRSEVPRFFEGRLPDFNLGTANGTSCDPTLSQKLHDIAKDHKIFSHDLNGRFKGGYITRAYGQPSENIHAVQLEQSQITYMQEEAPFTLDLEKKQKATPILRDFIQTMLDYTPA